MAAWSASEEMRLDALSSMTLSSALLFIIMMLIRRLLAFNGSSLLNKTAEPKPITRNSLLSSIPPAINSRLEAFALSADSSQLL